jgi:hypothetical protein
MEESMEEKTKPTLEELVQKQYNTIFNDFKTSKDNAPIVTDVLRTMFKYSISVDDALTIFDDSKKMLLRILTI